MAKISADKNDDDVSAETVVSEAVPDRRKLFRKLLTLAGLGITGALLSQDKTGLLPKVNATVPNGYVMFAYDGGFLSHFGGDPDFFWDYRNRRLGIGTDSPSYLLDVWQGWARFTNNTQYIPPSHATGGLVVGFNRSNGACEVNLYNVFSPPASSYSAITSFVFSQVTGDITYKDLLTIMGNGNVGIGTTNPGVTLQVGNNGDGSSALANAWNTFSDLRFKTNIQELGPVMDLLKRVRAVKFDWKNGKGNKQVGVVAQELEQVFPELVTKTGTEEYRSVEYGRLTTILLQAVKEQQETIERLQERIDVLEHSTKQFTSS